MKGIVSVDEALAIFYQISVMMNDISSIRLTFIHIEGIKKYEGTTIDNIFRKTEDLGRLDYVSDISTYIKVIEMIAKLDKFRILKREVHRFT